VSGFLTPQAPARVSDAPPAVVAHDRLSRNLLWSYGAWAASAFAPLVTVPFCVRCLGNRLYGEWLIIMSLAAYLGLANLGLAQTVGNRIAVAIARKRRDEVGTLVATGFWTYALIAIALITMLLLGAHASGHS